MTNLAYLFTYGRQRADCMNPLMKKLRASIDRDLEENGMLKESHPNHLKGSQEALANFEEKLIQVMN